MDSYLFGEIVTVAYVNVALLPLLSILVVQGARIVISLEISADAPNRG